MPDPRLEELLEAAEAQLLAMVRKYGAGLLRYEMAEDLAQAVHLRALQALDGFRFEGEAAFRGWLAQLVRRTVADRHDYWTAARRNGGAMVRVTQLGPRSTLAGGVDPAGSSAGPFTFAERRDQLELAARAVDALLPRDQKIVAMLQAGRAVAEMATVLEISRDAAERARLRAIERFQAAYRLLA
ncbi:MAG: RNA polymerase sigma factor (sigma-70 family), partial [Planctomycetota bacterium]